MRSQPNTGPARTGKEDRKAAAAGARDPALFERTEFGRRRVQSPWLKRVLALLALASVPIIYVYRRLRTPTGPD